MGMRIGVLSDTHLYRVSAELKEIYSKYLLDTDLVLHAGDIVSLEVVEFLKSKHFQGVSGNMDPLEVKAILPNKKIVRAGKFRIGLIHGWGSSEGLEKRVLGEFTDVDIIVYGHSHRAFNRKKEGVLLFNPGTATGPSLKGGNSIGILDLDDKINSRIISL
ncbi:metallophosphoesterase family protein [Thermodesulfobacteriota bacterium]